MTVPDQDCVQNNSEHTVIEVREPMALTRGNRAGQQTRDQMHARYHRHSEGIQLLPPETPV